VVELSKPEALSSNPQYYKKKWSSVNPTSPGKDSDSSLLLVPVSGIAFTTLNP
jgi:hypothetical protein